MERDRMQNERLKYCLDVWREWMHHDNAKLGYPSKAACFATGGISCYDDMEEAADKAIVDAVNGVMASWREVNKSYRCLVIEISLGLAPKVFTFNRMSFEDALDDAHVSMEIGLRKRGVL
jgi:hypothetical protein